MVRQVFEFAKSNRDAFNWVARFGAAVIIGLYLVWFVCTVFDKLVDAQLRGGEKNSEAMQTMAIASQKVADNTDSAKEMTRAVLASMKERSAEHADQAMRVACIDERITKRIDQQDEKLSLIAKGVQQTGDAMKQSLEIQTQILKRIEEKK